MGNICCSLGRTKTEELDPSLQGVHIERLNVPSDEFATVAYHCLNNEVLPLLKDYIAPVTQRLYDQLVCQNRINTQCIPNILDKYEGFVLRYVNINKNSLNNQKDSWDYRVSGTVDLTKLFMDYKKDYEEFLNCEVVELLDIIHRIYLFPKKVRIKAAEFKEEVRNSVAHFRTTEWTSEKFMDSLNKMKDLILTLDIPEYKKEKSVKKISAAQKDGMLPLLIDEIDVVLKFKLGGDEAAATIHGLSDEQQRRALRTLSTENNDDKSSFVVTVALKQSIRLDLTSNMTIYDSPKSFKIAVYKLLHRVIKASGVSRTDDASLDVEFVLPKTLNEACDKHPDFASYSTEDLAKLLTNFYVHARKKDGTKYKLFNLKASRFGLSRQLDIDIGHDGSITEGRMYAIPEQLLVVAKAFPCVLERKVEKAILANKMKKEARKWKEVREKTIPELKKIEHKLIQAADGLESFRFGRNVATGLSILGIVAASFTGGASLAALGLTVGTVTFVVSFVFEKHLTGEVMKTVQVAIDIDKATTKMLREQAKHFADKDDELAKQLLENFPELILAVLAVSFLDFLKGFIDSTADSVRLTKSQVENLRKKLESELQKVEDIIRRESSLLEVSIRV